MHTETRRPDCYNAIGWVPWALEEGRFCYMTPEDMAKYSKGCAGCQRAKDEGVRCFSGK